jgi:uncharacterized protein with PQ loop repeat
MFKSLFDTAKNYLKTNLGRMGADTMGWLAVVMLHAATIPSLLAVLKGLTDKVPSIDVVFFVWTSLLLYFIRSILVKDLVIMITISIGFVIQASLMALILFK